jgi:hypothetical protein
VQSEHRGRPFRPRSQRRPDPTYGSGAEIASPVRGNEGVRSLAVSSMPERATAERARNFLQRAMESSAWSPSCAVISAKG